MPSTTAQQLSAQLASDRTKLGDIKKIAKALKTDHALARELWSTGAFRPRLLSTLIFDKKQLSQAVIEGLAADMQQHDDAERNQLADWLLANQLMKDKQSVALLSTWRTSGFATLRRLFWYHQARLRWTGQAPPDNSAELVGILERELGDEVPEVRWTMNFCAGQIGIHEPALRDRCVALGKRLGLYEHDPVSRNCTPSYLPEFIRIEVAKREQ